MHSLSLVVPTFDACPVQSRLANATNEAHHCLRTTLAGAPVADRGAVNATLLRMEVSEAGMNNVFPAGAADAVSVTPGLG